MRKLLISVFALLAGLAPVPALHAAGTDSGPEPNARPVDPDYESGKNGVLVSSVSADGPAAKGGLKDGDLIVDLHHPLS